MKHAVISALKDLANDAGNVSGNADLAMYLMSHYKTAADIDKVIEAIDWAEGQATRTLRASVVAREKLKQFKAQAQGGTA
jgi:hypothetical protein